MRACIDGIHGKIAYLLEDFMKYLEFMVRAENLALYPYAVEV
jgi:hypothetical protein